MEKSKLCLGTIQFGMRYGINNSTGKPARDDVFEMLDYARKNGIDTFDTASVYGEAEQLLGEYARAKNCKSNLKVISKLKSGLINNSQEPKAIIENEIKECLKKLNLEVLYGYLLHNADEFYNDRIMDGLMECRKKGLVQNIGVSIYNEQQAHDVIFSKKADFIQLPYNVLDQRMARSGLLSAAKQNGVTVFARSALLQGLILMNEEAIPSYLEKAKSYLRTFDSIISKYGFTRLQAAMLFCLRCKNIDYVVFGVDNITQLEQNILISNEYIDFTACMEEIAAHFVQVEDEIIIPSLWGKAN